MQKLIDFIKSNKWVLYPALFIAGGILTYLFLPERIKIEEKEVITYKDKIVEKEVIKYQDRVVEKVVEVYKKTYKKTIRIQLPDGTIKEETVEYSSTEELTRLEESIKEQYSAKLLEKETEWAQEKSKLTEQVNPKRAELFVSYNVSKISEQEYMAGGTYNLWGPIRAGLAATNKGSLYPIIGIQF